MAISEICQHEVKKEIDGCLEEGMSRREAASWLADVFSDQLGRKISPETIRTKDKRARKALGSFEPKKESGQVEPKGKPVCKECKRRPALKDPKEVKFIGLCRWCRDEKVAEERQQKIIEEFDAAPVDEVSNKFWDDFAEGVMGFNLVEGDIPDGKVSDEVREKLELVDTLLRKCVWVVLKNSTRPKML